MLLLQGATTAPPRADHPFSGFNMLLLRGATQDHDGVQDADAVSIHAPLARSNIVTPFVRAAVNRFQYMLLLRGATQKREVKNDGQRVSIHAPLARSNATGRCPECTEEVSIHAPLARSNRNYRYSRYRLDSCFNTCSSREEQLPFFRHSINLSAFQYMLLSRGATGVI